MLVVFLTMTLPCDRFVRKYYRRNLNWSSFSDRCKKEVRGLRRFILRYRLRDGAFKPSDDDYLEYINYCIERAFVTFNSRPSTFVQCVIERIPLQKRTVTKDLEFLSMCSVWFGWEPSEE